MESHSLNRQELTIRILNYISTAFSVALLALQFIPFWGCFQCSTCGDGKVISIIEYVWFANNHSDGLTSILKNYYIEGFMAMDVVGTAVLIQLCAIAGVVLSILRPTKASTAALPMVAGLASFGYLAPAYQLGQNWQMHLAIGAVTLVSSLVVMLVAFIQSYSKTKAQVLTDLAE